MRILGIDPGIGTTGWSVLDVSGLSPHLVAAGTITTDRDSSPGARLSQLQTEIRGLIESYRPTTMILERLFFAKNITTAMQVSEARGVILCVAAQWNLELVEYSPPQVKQAITGYGKASKRQVIDMLKHHLPGVALPTQDDAADAVAISLTHVSRVSPVSSESRPLFSKS